MKVRILGAHNTESSTTRYMTLLVDDVLALDAGGLTSTLSFAEQVQLKAVLLTHHHYDHLRDIPALAMNRYLRSAPIDVYSHQAVFDALDAHFLNGSIYSQFQKERDSQAILKYHLLQPGQENLIAGLKVQAWPMNHSQPALGYLITAPSGASLFYTGDTGIGLEQVWREIDPQVLFIELTAPNRWEQSMIEHKHLTSSLLERELQVYYQAKGRLPRIITVHMNPESEAEIAGELRGVAARLKADIQMAREGRLIYI
jgi:ribonuclease BN (tRNA processing enzyme)